MNLRETDLENNLGFHIEPLLNFSANCENRVNKGNQILDLIRRS